jgi:regulator of sigma E protease
MNSVLWSALFFIVTLGVLITFHEFGHYWVARKLGVKVLRFSVGFGRPLWMKRYGSDATEYVIAALPFGGFVKMLDEREGEVAPHEVHRAFNRQSLPRRAAIVAAGPVFNFLLALGLFWLAYVLGVAGLRPIVGDVVQGTPAAEAGIAPGDEIIAVGDSDTPTWSAAIMALLDHGLAQESVNVTVENAAAVRAERQLDLARLSASLDQGNVLDVLGLQPARPKIPAVVGHIEAGSPAAAGGLQTGDRIVSADDMSITDWARWVDYVRSKPDRLMRVDIDRAGERVVLEIRPAAKSDRSGVYGRIGAAPQEAPDVSSQFSVVVSYGPVAALWQAVVKTWDVTALTLRLLGRMVVGEVSLSNLSGPLSIAQYAGGSASIGFVPFVTFLAIVSVSLGVLNLLPVPVLDGGHLLFYAAEAIKGKPLSAEAEMLGQRIGVLLIVALMILAVYNDLLRIFG